MITIEPLPEAANIKLARILLVTHYFPAHGGGLERVAEEIAGRLATTGRFPVTWMSSDDAPPPRNLAEGSKSVAVPSWNFVERTTQLPYPLWSPRALYRLWRAVGDAEIVHVHEHVYVSSIAAILFARLRKRPSIVTQHMGALRMKGRLASLLYLIGTRAMAWVVFAAANRVVFISSNVRSFYRMQRSPKARLIYNGVDVGRFTPADKAGRRLARSQLGIESDRQVVLFVGRFVRKKGLRLIEELARRTPDIRWLLVGSGPEEPQASPHGNLVLVGRVEHDELPIYYRAADILVLPSAGEGFPLVVQEALCCGTGVLSTEEVATACPEASRLVKVGPDPQATDAASLWVSALREALADDAYDAGVEERARIARELWSWDGCVSRYIQEIDSLMADTAAR